MTATFVAMMVLSSHLVVQAISSVWSLRRGRAYRYSPIARNAATSELVDRDHGTLGAAGYFPPNCRRAPASNIGRYEAWRPSNDRKLSLARLTRPVAVQLR